jgi:CheY-like chemotaxis protein
MPKRILIVEDDTDMVELLRFNLKTVGYALGTAADGIEALKKARSIRPEDFILSQPTSTFKRFVVQRITINPNLFHLQYLPLPGPIGPFGW